MGGGPLEPVHIPEGTTYRKEGRDHIGRNHIGRGHIGRGHIGRDHIGRGHIGSIIITPSRESVS